MAENRALEVLGIKMAVENHTEEGKSSGKNKGENSWPWTETQEKTDKNEFCHCLCIILTCVLSTINAHWVGYISVINLYISES